MSGRAPRNNLKAGIFLAVALVTFMAICMKLGDVIGALTESRATYVVRFSLNDGAMGLKKGSMVKVGGQQVGEVTQVSFKRPPKSKDVPQLEAQQVAPGRAGPGEPAESQAGGRQAPGAVFVTISVRREVMLFHDAKVYLELPLLGSVSTINIPDVGGGEYTVPGADARSVVTKKIGELDEWEIVPGTLAPPAFLGQAGYGAEQKEQLQIILQRGKEISVQLEGMVSSSRSTLDGTLGSLREAADTINQATGSVNKQLPDWLTAITKTLANVQGASGEAEQRLIEFKAIVATVKNTLDENRQYLDRLFQNSAKASDNIVELTDKVNKELYGAVRDALADGRRALVNIAEVTEKANQFAAEKTPELGRMIANARLASDQLKLTMTEVRRNPWRLLYQPTRREIEEELTYDSARTYADAVGQLRAASDSLQAVLAQASGKSGSEPTPQQRQQLDVMTAEIREAFDRYREAEKRFLDRLTKDK